MSSRVAPGPPALPPTLRRPIGIAAVLSAVVVAGLGLAYGGDSTGTRLDGWVESAVAARFAQPGPGAGLIDLVGDPRVTTVLAVALAAICFAGGRRRLALVAIAGPGLTGILVTVLKPVVGRTIHGDNLAYPSGHTAAATALALVALLLLVDLLQLRALAGALLILVGTGGAGAVMAVDQIALSAHYPTDTLGGFCTATALVPATAWLADRISDRRSDHP